MKIQYQQTIKVDLLILYVPLIFIVFTIYITHNSCTSKYLDSTSIIETK